MTFKHWLKTLLNRHKVEDELNEELQYHVERQIEENIKNGMPAEEARYAALRAFGNRAGTEENLRSMRALSSIETVAGDIRCGFRLLRRSPAFAAFAVASLAMGIGAMVAIFTLLNAIVLRDLPVGNPKQLVSLYMTMPGRSPNWSLPYPQFEAMRTRNTTLDGLVAVNTIGRVSVSTGGETELATAEAVTGDYFRLLGLQPPLGRLLTAADDVPGSAVAVITHGYWQRRFGAAPNVIGSSITINHKPFTIVGVEPKAFLGLEMGRAIDIRIPIRTQDRAPFDEAFATWIYVVGRLKAGASLQSAEQELDLIYRQVSATAAAAAIPQERESRERLARDVRLRVESGARGTISGLRENYRGPLQFLLILIGAVLLMASLNVGTLLLARSAARQKEISTRLALGASRWRVVRQLLTESILLSAAAGSCALLLSVWGSELLLRMAMPSVAEPAVNLNLDLRVVLFTVAASTLTWLMFGLIPAIRSTSVGAVYDRPGGHRPPLQLDRALVGAQVALSLLILVSAGLFARSLQSLWTRDTGYDRQNVLMFSIDPTLSQKQPSEIGIAYKEILRELQALPGVEAATVSVVRPVSDGMYLIDRVSQIGDRPVPQDQPIRVAFNNVAPGYFSTLRIPLVVGREFEEQDNQAESRTVVISDTMARLRFKNENPVGQFISLGRDRRQIIGVAADVRYANVTDAPREVVYRPVFQGAPRFPVSFQLRYRGNREDALADARAIVGRTDPSSAMFNIKTLETQTSESLAKERLLAALSGYFGGFAVLLMCIGLYGLLNYSVARRTSELGLRMALGAKSQTLYWMILRESFVTVALGSVIGIVLALGVTRLLQAQLFDIGPYDPLAFGAATALLAIMAFLASIIPAARAARLDPITALKYE